MSNSLNLSQILNDEVNRELARRQFWDFCEYYDKDFFAKRQFLKEIADAFQKVYINYSQGKSIKVSVSVSPRAGKSYLTSLFCAWWLGKFPEECVMRNTVTSSLYRKFSYDVRDIIKSPKYKEVFYSIELAPDKQNIDGWNLTSSKQGAYFGGGVGTNIIGFGANLAITDDLYSGFEQALSETYNESVHTWKAGSHNSRMEKNCPEIFIGTRWAVNDVIGKVIESKEIDIEIKIPALIEGKSFCEAVKTTEEYLKIKNTTDESIWDAEYMQQPIEAKGSLFPRKELNYYKPAEILQFETSLAYCDVADEGSDNLSMPIGKNIKDRIYIPEIIFTKENADVSIELCADALKRHKAAYCRVESNGMGAMFGRNLSKLVGDCQVLPCVSTSNKHTRILMDAGFIKRHCWFLHEDYQDDNYKRFMQELCSYVKEGKSKHDDAPDSMSGLVIFIRGMLSHLYQ